MEPLCAWEADVIAKLASQGAERREDSDNESSLAFSVEINGKRRGFLIPRATLDGGYGQSHLTQIEEQLTLVGLDLLPLDSNLH